MGVSGSGKTTIGKRLARRLGFEFADADAYHPQANIDKMAAGVPLTDADRRPWLAALRALIEAQAAGGRSLVLGCSALKRSYREALAGERAADGGRAGGGREPRVTFVYLRADYDTILERMERRQGHYMKGGMLESQFRDLEEPQDAVTVDVTGSVAAAVRQALSGLAGRGVTPPAPGRSDAEPRRRDGAPPRGGAPPQRGGHGGDDHEEEPT